MPSIPTRFAVALAGATLAFAAPALAYDACSVPADFKLTEKDTSRLSNLDTSRTRGLGAALRSESAADRGDVAELFDSGLAPVDPDLLPGAYRCRTIKMGGNGPALVVYQWFQCEITEQGEGFAVGKVTGSQNFNGVLVPAGAGYAYRGALTYGYEDTPVRYGENAERNQVGCLSAVTKGNRHFVLELPFPVFESFHDVIEFVPAE